MKESEKSLEMRGEDLIALTDAPAPGQFGNSLLNMADVASGWGRGVAAQVLRAAGQTMLKASALPLSLPLGLLTGIDLDGAAPELHQLHRFVYLSRGTGRDSAQAARHATEILRVARLHNARVGLTGALLHSQSWFGQVLEGDLVEIERLFLRISRDPRNMDVRVLTIRPIRRRAFAAWSMAAAGEAPELMIRRALNALTDVPAMNAVLREMMVLVRRRLGTA